MDTICALHPRSITLATFLAKVTHEKPGYFYKKLKIFCTQPAPYNSAGWGFRQEKFVRALKKIFSLPVIKTVKISFLKQFRKVFCGRP
ncbi:hypothetical protein [Dethiosulfatarculus sandiegensis]|uniref:hypothetical protein n=1 Tax=Dethiosulfatarculus sandiegensis TaxID=1429043 RepID=UPI0012E30B2E|nr:hypothetical protein [Dethiosulfatarculus sandiegensis]